MKYTRSRLRLTCFLVTCSVPINHNNCMILMIAANISIDDFNLGVIDSTGYLEVNVFQCNNIFSFFLAVSLETLVENCHKLLEKFHYSWEMMPLVLVILNYAGSDLDEASRKIDEGKKPSESKCIMLQLPSTFQYYYIAHVNPLSSLCLLKSELRLKSQRPNKNLVSF